MEEKQKVIQTPVPQESDRVEKPGGIIHSIVVVLLALLVVIAVTVGVFYFAIKNNINGLAYVVKPSIENNFILKLALPTEFLPKDLDDPKYLTQKDILKKYNEYRAKTNALNESLAKANDTIEQMKNNAEITSSSADILKADQAVLEAIKNEQIKLDADRKALSELIASGDTKGFRDYFQKVDKATAEAIYKEIISKETLSEKKLALAKPFSAMKPASAAGVLVELLNKDKETLLDIFEGLKSNAAALILEQIDANTAAEITKLLFDRKQDR